MANQIYLFGELKIESSKRKPPKIRKTLRYALLGYLVFKEEPVQREEICKIFWPDIPAAQGRANLRNTLARLRKDFPDLIEIDENSIAFNAQFADFVDVYSFREGVYRSQRSSQFKSIEEKSDFLISLIDLYCGEFLLGFDLSIGSAYEEWLRLERQIFDRELIEIFFQLLELSTFLGNYVEGVAYAERLIQFDPLNEKGHHHLMLFHQQRGNLREAQKVFEQYVSAYQKAFGESPPTSEISELYLQIGRYLREEKIEFKGQTGRAIADIERYVPPPVIGKLFGREREIARLRQLFTLEGKRLVTIQGIGGVGKTALAKTIANQLKSIFEYGVCFVELVDMELFNDLISTMAFEENVVQSILQSLGVKFSMQANVSAEDFLIQFFRQKSMLLVLDNFEHVVPAKALVARLLTQLPSLKFLVTSREALNIRGEQIVQLRGLPVPNDGEALNTESFASVELFLDLVRQKGLEERVNPSFVQEVGQLVQSIDGLPLALEITADAVMHYSPIEISENLNKLQDFASDYSYDLPDRHLTLRRTFEFSWELLEQFEKELLIGLTIFRGKFSRSAVQSIFQTELPVLSSLIQKSMLNSLGGGYYRFHSLLKEFVLDKRVEFWETNLNEEAGQIYQDYYRFYLSRMASNLDQLAGFHPVQIVREFREEQLELEAAWKIAAESSDTLLMLQSLEATKSYYKIIRDHQAGESIFQIAYQTLKRVSDGSPEVEKCIIKLHLAYVEFMLRGTKMDLGRVELDKLRRQDLALEDAFQRTLLSVVYLIERLGETEAAVETLKSFLEDPRGYKFPNIRTRAYLYIAFAYFHEFRYSDALQWSRMAFEQFKANNLGIGAAETSILLSSIYVNSFIEPEEVFNALKFAQEYYELEWTPSISGIVEERIGLYYAIVKEDFQLGVKQYLAALNIYKKANLISSIYNTLSTLGYDHYFAGKYNEADEYFQEMDLVDKTNIQPIPLTNGYFEWSQFLLAQYRFEETQNVYERIFQLDISQNAREQFQWGFAWFYIRLGQFDLAREQMSVDPTQIVNNRWYSLVMALGYVNYFQGNLVEAKSFADLFWAQHESPHSNIPPDRMNRYHLITLQMGDLFRLLGDFDKATLIYEDVLNRIPRDVVPVGHINLRYIGIKLGMADMARQQGDMESAASLAQEVTSFLKQDPYAYHINLFQPYLILYRIFIGSDAEFAKSWLKQGILLIDQIASNLRNHEMRASFLQHSPNVALLKKLLGD